MIVSGLENVENLGTQDGLHHNWANLIFSRVPVVFRIVE